MVEPPQAQRCHEHPHHASSRRRRLRTTSRVERLVAAAAVFLSLSTSPSAVTHGFQQLSLPSSQSSCCSSSFSLISKRTTASSSRIRRRSPFSLPACYIFSSALCVSTSSVSERAELAGTASLPLNGKDQTSTSTTTKRDAAAVVSFLPISRSYQRQMRAMMEQATTIQQEQQPEMEADDDDVIVTTASSASSKVASLVSPEEYQRGLLTIGFCTLVFASMSPAMHACLVSSSSDIGQTLGAPPVLLLNAAVSAVAFAGLVLAGPFLERVIPQPSTLQMVQEQKTTEQSSSSSSSVKNKNKATILEFSSQTMMSSTTTTTTSSTFMNENPFTSRNPFTISITNRAGVELGLWKFLGTTANLFGLSLTSADHGAFLIQLTTLIVPTVQGVMGVPIPRRIQASIALALLGVALFTQDFSAVTSAVSATADTTGDVDTAAALLLSTSRERQLTGDALCVLAAVFYATYDLRLYEWGKRVAPRALITTKIGAQALFSLALLLGAPGGAWSESVAFLQAATDSISNGFDNATLLMLIPLILWSGFMVNAIVPFLQVGGQQAIGPTRAQTLYASQPLWAAIMSYFFLGETVGVPGMIGGGAFLAALFLAATAAPATSPAAALLESSSGSSSDISPRINTETTTAPGTSVTTAKSAIAAEQAM